MDSWEPEDEDDGDGHLAASFPKKNPRVIKEDDGDAESDMDSEDQDQELELATRGAAKRARAGSSAPAEAAAEAGKAAIMKQVEADAALAASLADQPPPPKKKRSSGKRKPAVVRRTEEEAAAAALGANGDVPPEEPPHDLCVKCQESHSYPGNELLLCDGDDCGSAYHLHCLRPKLLAVPKGDWCVPRPSALQRRPTRRPTRRQSTAQPHGRCAPSPHVQPLPRADRRACRRAQVLPFVLFATACPRQARGRQFDRQDSRRSAARHGRI